MPGPRGLAKHRGERESYERIGERCEEIAQELEGLIDGLDAASITEGGVGGARCALGGPLLELRHPEPVIGVIEGQAHVVPLDMHRCNLLLTSFAGPSR